MDYASTRMYADDTNLTFTRTSLKKYKVNLHSFSLNHNYSYPLTLPNVG